jgi:hypothetical protein
VLEDVEAMATELRGELWRVAPRDVVREMEAMREKLRRGDLERVWVETVSGRSAKRRRL